MLQTPFPEYLVNIDHCSGGKAIFCSRRIKGENATIAVRLAVVSRFGTPTRVNERNGRHEETRTPDLYRVKVAL
jgi:hypothetical protein